MRAGLDVARAGCGVIAAVLLAASARAGCERSYTIPIWSLGYASYSEQDGTPGGIFGDLFREVAKRSGCNFRYESIPVPRINLMARARKVPMRAPAGAPYPEDDADMVFIPMMRDAIQLVIAKNKRAQFDLSPPLDKSIVVGVLRGARYGDWVEQWLTALPEGQVEQINGTESLYRMLGAGRVQATFANAYVYRWHLKALHIENEFAVLPVPEARSVLIGVKLDKQALSAADFALVARQIEAVRDDGTFARFIARYLGDVQARENTAGVAGLPRQVGK